MVFRAILTDNKKATTLQQQTINYYNPILKAKNNKIFMGNGTLPERERERERKVEILHFCIRSVVEIVIQACLIAMESYLLFINFLGTSLAIL